MKSPNYDPRFIAIMMTTVIDPADVMTATMAIATIKTTSTVTAALLQDPIVTATIAVPSSLLSSTTPPDKDYDNKGKVFEEKTYHYRPDARAGRGG